LPRTIERKRFHFSIHRPWTHNFHHDNMPGKSHQFVHVEPVKNWSFFRGDRVRCFIDTELFMKNKREITY